MRPQLQRAAFTLIELLVVIAVIALLLGLLVPVLTKAGEQSRRVACLGNIRQFIIGIQAYASDNGEYLPSGLSDFKEPQDEHTPILSGAIPAQADVYVHGYFRSNGTYVRPHYRSNPDGNFYNNWSTYPNINPYTGARGTRRTPSYSRGYSSLMPRYNSGSSPSSYTWVTPYPNFSGRSSWSSSTYSGFSTRGSSLASPYSSLSTPSYGSSLSSGFGTLGR